MRKNILKDRSLADEGIRKINWVKRNMPILKLIEKDFSENQYFKGKKITVSVHLEAKTAALALLLAAGGAEVSVTGSNSMSTKDDVVAALDKLGLHVFAIHGSSEKEYYEHINAALDIEPDIIIDDGGDLVHLVHFERSELAENIMGACEETTTGVERNQELEKQNKLLFPVIAVNNAMGKYLFDNRYGSGQSVMDALLRTTNLLITGKKAVVCGYGWVGKGVADKLKGMGASVIVTEKDPVKALEAVMDGFSVMNIKEAAESGDFFVTAAGRPDVLTQEHFKLMKDGVILSNAGHFPYEINIKQLNELSEYTEEVRENIFGYKLKSGKWINVLGNANIVNISCADGHPAEIMDMSFALQALSALYVLQNNGKLENRVIKVPEDIDIKVAELKLESLGVKI